MKTRYILWILTVFLWSSCIRDSVPPCPPLQVTLTVKDKNYFNINDAVKLGLLERKAEDLPFRNYVSTLYYIVHDAEGNVVAEQKNTQVNNDEQTQLITLPLSLPYGTYSVTVWGNMKSDEPLGEDATIGEMEAVGAAANDIYLASATFDYRYGNEEHTLAMERTKGNLLIKAEGIPDNIDFSTKDIQDIYNFVDNGFQYSSLTDIHTELDWQEIRSEIKSETLMCPSPSYEGSTLSVTFIDKSALETQGRATYYPTLEPQDVNITMGRNEITILKYVYTDQGEDTEGEFEIYVRVNDNWQLIHNMEID